MICHDAGGESLRSAAVARPVPMALARRRDRDNHTGADGVFAVWYRVSDSSIDVASARRMIVSGAFSSPSWDDPHHRSWTASAAKGPDDVLT